MKLILFADRLPPLIGGMETHAHYFVQYFKSKIDLRIVSKSNGQDILVDFNYKPIKAIDINTFLSDFRNEKIVLFFNSGRWIENMTAIRKQMPHAIILYRTGGNEIIQSPLTCDIPVYEERKKYWRETINYSVDRLITNSCFTDERLKKFGISKNIICQIPGGIDEHTIRSAIDNKLQTKKQYGLSDSDKLIVSCTRFVPYKRVDLLIEAISMCKSGATLIIAGNGPLETDIKRYTTSLDYPIKVLPALPHRQAVGLIAAADVYVQASADYNKSVEGGSYIHTEGMGRSLIEAVCCGVPVVVTKCGAVEEFINRDNGAVVFTKEAITTSVDRFIANETTFTQNIDRYIKQYSFTTIFERYTSLWM